MAEIRRKEFKTALERIRAGVHIGQDQETVIRYCLQETTENNWQIRVETKSGYQCRVASDLMWLEAAGLVRERIEQRARETNNYVICEDLSPNPGATDDRARP